MATVVRRSGEEITIEVSLPVHGSLQDMEHQIQRATNAAGCCATAEALGRFDTDGSPIRVGDIKLTARARDPKEYQTPYGPVSVERYVYQTSRGGRIYCPLETAARIVRGATPLFARQISHKYAQLNAGSVQRDLADNHGRCVARSYIQHVGEWVGTIAMAKEETCTYELPALAQAITTVAVSLDGAMIPMADSSGYREAMVGALSFYDTAGERQHTIYLAAAPEYGKQTFTERLTREITAAKQHYPDARFIGIADGAAANWSFLTQHTEQQLIDFYHASEYLALLAQARYPASKDQGARERYRHDQAHRLKHDPHAVDALINEAERLGEKRGLSQAVREGLRRAWTYFTNHRHQMDYPGFLAEHLPIGSGVTEAACKTLVKQRLCASGMRWKTKGAGIVLSLRALSQTTGRWQQFWQRIDQFGAACFG